MLRFWEQVKTYLNGLHIRGLLTIRTLAAKLLGIVFAIGAGVIAGKEGPFVVRPWGSRNSLCSCRNCREVRTLSSVIACKEGTLVARSVNPFAA